MSLKNKELIEKGRYELTFNVERSVFEDAVRKVYKKQANRITVPGFRRGHAPLAVVRKMYGNDVFFEDAANEVLPAAFADASKESGLDIVGYPEFELKDVEDGKDIEFSAKVYIKPEVKIEGYKGIKATRTIIPVSDADVEAEIERVRARNSRMIEITDRAAQNGDTANIDFDGYVNNKPFSGGKGEKYDLVLGSGSFIPGFEDQVVGHNIGDEFEVNVTFPKDYHEKSLAGKDSVFKCKLNAIKVNEKPELNDDFAKDVSEFDTLAEYTADVRAKLEEAKKKEADAAVESSLMETLVDKMEAEIPQTMFDAEVENLVRDYDTRLRMQGLDLSTYLKYTGMTLNQIREQLKPQAQRQVKLRLTLEEIAKLEKCEATDEEIEAEYKRLADAYGQDIDKIKSQIASEDIAADLKVGKAADIVKENAKITDEAPAAEKKPAKKTTAKKSAAKSDAEAAEEKPAKKVPAKKTAAKKAEGDDKADEGEKKPAKKAPAKKAAPKSETKPKKDSEEKPAKKVPAKKSAKKDAE